MEIYRSASLQSQFRGLDYFKEKKVIYLKKINDSEYNGQVKGNNKIYDVFINIEHPKNIHIVIVP